MYTVYQSSGMSNVSNKTWILLREESTDMRFNDNDVYEDYEGGGDDDDMVMIKKLYRIIKMIY